MVVAKWVSFPNSRIKELRKQDRSEKGFVIWIKWKCCVTVMEFYRKK